MADPDGPVTDSAALALTLVGGCYDLTNPCGQPFNPLGRTTSFKVGTTLEVSSFNKAIMMMVVLTIRCRLKEFN